MLQSLATRAADMGSIAKSVAYSSMELASTSMGKASETLLATTETIKTTADNVGITKNLNEGIPLLILHY
jgi:hypothetical protein